MPVYSYVCKSCDYRFDKIIRRELDRASTATCPECGQEAERGIELPSQFQWKNGKGWS